jgi:hypothetical protein
LDGDEPVSSRENRPITEDAIVAQQVTSSVIKAMTRVLTNIFHGILETRE